MMPNVLSAVELTRTFLTPAGDVHAVRGVTFHVGEGAGDPVPERPRC